MNSPVQQIKERLSIEEIVSSYIKLEKAGANLKAKCPFHNEKTPSFFISPVRNSYYCFGCGASGDIFTFVEEFEGLDFKGALKLLADRAGVQLPHFNPKEESEREKLYRVVEEATRFFEKNLEGNQPALDYLRARGLEDKTIQNFRIGYAWPDWRRLYEYLKSKNFSDAEIEKAGLAKRPEEAGKAMYDRFRGRIIFPIADSSGRVIAFSGRIFPDDPSTGSGQAISQAKYLNSPETPIFSKNAVLFGIDKAKDSIRRNNFSILVEGQMDLILSHQAGYRNTVATSGTALSDSTFSKENVISNLGLVRRLSPNIVLSFDADSAGENATLRAGKIALALGMDVKVAEMPEGIDPADLIRQNGLSAWKEIIKNSKHIIEFILGKILKNSSDARQAGKEIKSKVLPFVNAVPSSIEKNYFIKKISDLSGIAEKALEEDLRVVEKEFKNEGEEIKEAEDSLQALGKKDYIERRLLGIAFWQEIQEKPVVDFKQIFEKVGNREKYENAKEDLIFQAEIFYANEKDLQKDTVEMLSRLAEEKINEQLAEKMRRLHLNKDKDLEMFFIKEINDLNKEKEKIKNDRLKDK